MSNSKFKRPSGMDERRTDPEEQYRAGYQHGAKAVIEKLLSPGAPDLEQLKRWTDIELAQWRHDSTADPVPPKVKKSR